MKLLFLLLLPLSIFCQTKVYVQIMQKHNYCGGARPNAEILSQYEKPRPFANKKLVIVSENGKACKVKTNTNGFFKAKLKPGMYKIYESWRYSKQTPDGSDMKNFDSECLKTTWEKVDGTLKVEIKSWTSEITIDEAYCPHTIPCLLNPQYPM